MASISLLGAACATRPAGPIEVPAADPGALAARAVAATAPVGPRHVTFSWTLDEGGSRVRGAGAARFAAPDHARLDLFGPRGETYLSAAMVGDEVRLPATAPADVPLPSPALLWGAMGIVRPPSDATLESGATSSATASLRYLRADGAIVFRLIGSGADLRLEGVERHGRGGVVESLRLEHGQDGGVARARYRDLAAYRELVLEVESVSDVASFPESIWSPGAQIR